MQVSKWGNSLAIRLPVAVVKDLGLKEGDEVEVCAGHGRVLEITRDLTRLKDIDARLNALAEIRKLARPLPRGYKFNREELHDRGVRDR